MNTAPSSRENCFDLLRLILAALVVYTHTYAIGGFGQEGFSRWNRGQTIAGSLGVLGFFGLSGFLVSDSFLRNPNWWQFLRRRALRIFPGFWGCLLVTALVLTPAIYRLQNGTLSGYAWTGPDGALSYILHNATLQIRQWGIGDVLARAAYPGSLNGSLWSLFPEFGCYLALLFIGSCGLLAGPSRVWLLVFTGLFAIFHLFSAAGLDLAPRTLPTIVTLTPLAPYLLAFFVGASCCAFRERLAWSRSATLFLSILLLTLLRLGGYKLAAPLVVPLLLLNLGHVFKVHLRHDFSYGFYIYAFPCQQLLALVPVLHSSAVLFFATSASLTALLAAASWFGIERRFLPRSRLSARAKHANVPARPPAPLKS